MKPDSIMEITMYEPTEIFLVHIRKHDEIYKGEKGEMQQKYDPFGFISYYYSMPILYFKDTDEFISLEEYLENEKAERETIELNNIIMFSYSATSIIDEEINQSGLDCFFRKEELSEWADFLERKTSIKHDKKNFGKVVMQRLESNGNLFHTTFFTAWESWSDKSWTDCGYEYDGGIDYCGIIDMNNLNFI